MGGIGDAHGQPVSRTAAALITQAEARTASANARGASAFEAVAGITTNEPVTYTQEVRPVAVEEIQFRPSLPAAGKATAIAAQAATAALATIDELPNPPKNVRLTAAAAQQAAVKAAAAPADVKLANLAAAAENAALEASSAAFGTTATKVEWIRTG
ncbi:hypothetical protein GCM10009764_20380 [Nocardia ninae]|uniref:Uncharacterized protein n=1 Tax=Nocardia ninae NBRC 108245 TaxID=1210091 RepID=A0A511MEV1_9NOCA|nr:hypothetical protein NN4_31960 [Nocardia ninae NBRC 108245]